MGPSPFLARLCDRKFMKELSSTKACWWLTMPMWVRQVRPQRLQLKVWSSLIWLLRFPGFSTSGVSPWGWLCGSPQRWRRPGGRCNISPDGQQQVSTTDDGQCGRYRGSSWGSLFNVPWCPSVTVASGEFAIQGYLGQAMGPPFWRHALPIVPVTSAT